MSQNNISRRTLLSNLGIGTLGLPLLSTQDANAQQIYNPNLTQLTQFKRGNTPILLVAPHGGTKRVFGIASRRNINRPVSNFSYYSAVWTREICTQISRTIERLSGGQKPYMVLNLAHRRYVDVNREESDAFEGILNSPRIYWEYHDLINEYVNRMNVLYKNPILIEITGQKAFPNLIIRRTLNGKTMQKLALNYGEKQFNKVMNYYVNAYNKSKNIHSRAAIKRIIKKLKQNKRFKILEYGQETYSGKSSFIGEIKQRGYAVSPKLIDETQSKESISSQPPTEQAISEAGNYTIERYGLREVSNINAMQIVIGSNFRRTSNFQQTGHDLGNALWAYVEKFIL